MTRGRSLKVNVGARFFSMVSKGSGIGSRLLTGATSGLYSGAAEGKAAKRH